MKIGGARAEACSAIRRRALTAAGARATEASSEADKAGFLGLTEAELTPSVQGALKTLLGEVLPKRFAQRLCEHWITSKPLRQYNAPELRGIADLLSSWPLVASGTEGYRTAEVTLGGIDTDQLSSATLQSKLVPGLFFVGEMVDVTGWLGGYNFQWAWASGHAAGEVA